jgi:4-amino-4-deoxy-L-arabinose transferase-like glycosyltransferase
MSKITGIGIALLLVICVPKILRFYDISLSTYAPYLAFLIFIIILAFILPHNFLVTVDTVASVGSAANSISAAPSMSGAPSISGSMGPVSTGSSITESVVDK